MISPSLATRRVRIPPLRGWLVTALVAAPMLTAVPVQADWTVVWEVSRQARGMGDDPHPVTVLLKGDRARFERSPSAVVLVDGATGWIYELDPGAKTYTVRVPGAPPMAPPPGIVVPQEEVSGTLRPEGGDKTVAGRPTRRYAAASKMSMTMPSGPQSQMPSLRADGELWVGEADQPAPRAMAAVLPLILAEEAEAGEAQQRMDRKLDRIYDLNMESVRKMTSSSMGTSMASLLRPITEQLVALGRPVLAARISWTLGPGMPPTDFAAEATSVAEVTHDEALFAVPADYRRVGADPGVVSEAPSGPVVPVPATAASFDRLAGVYSLPNGEVLVTREGDRLFADAAGRPREELVPAGGSAFRVGRQPAEMTFFQDAEGRVTHAVLVMQGTEMRAPRVR